MKSRVSDRERYNKERQERDTQGTEIVFYEQNQHLSGRNIKMVKILVKDPTQKSCQS